MNIYAIFLAFLIGQSDLDSPSIGVVAVPFEESSKTKTGGNVEFPKKDGVLAVGLFPYSPAAEAKLKPLDFIIAADNKPLKSSDQLADIVKNMGPDDKIRLDVLTHIQANGKVVWGKPRSVITGRSTKRDIALNSIRSETDQITGEVFYWHRDSPGDKMSGEDVSLFFSAKDGAIGPLNVRASHVGKWNNNSEVLASTGKDPVTLIPPSSKWTFDGDFGLGSEWSRHKLDSSQIQKLMPVLLNYRSKIRFSGKHDVDRSFTPEERSRMLIMIYAYQAKGGKL